MASGGTIREAAAALFLARGYAATSMDDIAAAAKVSKQTIYTHFAHKEALFTDLVLGNVQRVDEFISGIPGTLSGARSLEAGLQKLARDYLGFVARHEVLRLRRLIIGEASRFPKLARRYYELVPGRVYGALAGEFERLGIRDPAMAAQHFAWLTLGLSLDRGMFYPAERAPGAAELDELAGSAVRVFLAAYRPS